MVTILTPEQKKDLKPFVIDLLRSIFGTDIGYSYNDNDGTIDLDIVGGDFNLSGTRQGGNLNSCLKMIRDRVNTRLLTDIGESALLPPTYGSFLSVINEVSNTSEAGAEFSNFASSLINIALEEEEFVEEVKDVALDINNNGLFIRIAYQPILLQQSEINMELRGD